MKKVMLGLAFAVALIISVPVFAQDAKAKKVVAQTETTKNDVPKAGTAQSGASGSSVKTTAPASCAASTKPAAGCCAASAKPAAGCCAASAKPAAGCCQVDKIIAEKKSEAKKKNQ